MAVLSLSVLVASITFVCYKAQWWPFSLFLPSSWRLRQQLKHATTATSGLDSHAANAKAAKSGTATSVVIDTPDLEPTEKKEHAGTPQLRLSSPTTSATPSTKQQAASNATNMRSTPPPEPSDSQLMPPPPVPNRSPNRAVPTSNSSSSSFLRTPPTASLSRLPSRNPTRLTQPTSSSLSPAPNRTASLLPPASASRAPTAPRTAAAGTVATSSAANPRRKVILAPGHSPLDWAALTRSGSNLSGVPFPQRVTPSQLAAMNGRKGKPAWSSFQGKVYNIGPYLPFHPGGEGELKRAAGRVGDQLFMEVHPWVNWEGMMGECLVGFLVDEAEGKKAADEGLEAMD